MGRSVHNCGSPEKESSDTRKFWGLSSFLVSETVGSLFSFLSNFLEVSCGIWVGFHSERLGVVEELPG